MALPFEIIRHPNFVSIHNWFSGIGGDIDLNAYDIFKHQQGQPVKIKSIQGWFVGDNDFIIVKENDENGAEICRLGRAASSWVEVDDETGATAFRLSTANGVAFGECPGFDFGPYQDGNHLVVFHDTTNNKDAWGYIKAEAPSGETLAADSVTDGGFAAVTETNVYTSDFSAGVNGWAQYIGDTNLQVTGNNDDIPNAAGLDDVLKAYANGADKSFLLKASATVLTLGKAYKVTYKYYAEAGCGLAFLRFGLHSVAADRPDTAVVEGSWQTVTAYYFNAVTSDTTVLYFSSITSQGGTGIDSLLNGKAIYIKDVVIDNITLTSWTAGTGCAPQASAGALTTKANAIAGTASDLSQNISAGTGKLYKVIFTVVRTAGSVTAKVGGSSGTTISASGTYTQYITCGSVDTNITFSKDATFAGSVDTVSVQQVTVPAATGALLVSTFGGAVRNFASIDAGFNPNLVTSFEVKEYHAAKYMTDRCHFKKGGSLMNPFLDVSKAILSVGEKNRIIFEFI